MGSSKLYDAGVVCGVCVVCGVWCVSVCSIYVTTKNVDVTPKNQRFRETEGFEFAREAEGFSSTPRDQRVKLNFITKVAEFSVKKVSGQRPVLVRKNVVAVNKNTPRPPQDIISMDSHNIFPYKIIVPQIEEE